MKRNACRWLLLLVASCALCTAQAADAGNGNGKNDSKKDKPDKVEKPERPTPPGQSNEGPGKSNKDLKAEFKAQAEAFQQKQKELLSQIKKASAEERLKIREQLVVLKENWKELNREYRDKLTDLVDKVNREEINDDRGGRPRK